MIDYWGLDTLNVNYTKLFGLLYLAYVSQSNHPDFSRLKNVFSVFIVLFPELDDGAYNPLWTMRGFTQTFHFWKENKRAQCVPLNAFLTYVTLPWWSIAKGLYFVQIDDSANVQWEYITVMLISLIKFQIFWITEKGQF